MHRNLKLFYTDIYWTNHNFSILRIWRFSKKAVTQLFVMSVGSSLFVSVKHFSTDSLYPLISIYTNFKVEITFQQCMSNDRHLDTSWNGRLMSLYSVCWDSSKSSIIGLISYQIVQQRKQKAPLESWWSYFSTLTNQVSSKEMDHSKPFAMRYKHEQCQKLTRIFQATEKSSPKYLCPDPSISSCLKQHLPLCRFSEILKKLVRAFHQEKPKFKT